MLVPPSRKVARGCQHQETSHATQDLSGSKTEEFKPRKMLPIYLRKPTSEVNSLAGPARRCDPSAMVAQLARPTSARILNCYSSQREWLAKRINPVFPESSIARAARGPTAQVVTAAVTILALVTRADSSKL